MDATQAVTLLVVSLGALGVPLVSARVGVPAAVGEILFGMMVGPFVLGIITETESFTFLAEFGFAFLMFLAGLELDFANLERRGTRLFGLCAGMALITLGFAFFAAYRMGWSPFFGLVLGATSIGLVLMTLRETGTARSDFGQTVILVGSIGEFLTIVVATLYNIVYRFGFGLAFVEEVVRLAVVFLIAYLVLKTLGILAWWFPSRFSRIIDINDPSEIGVRAGLALMIAFVAVTVLLGMEAILGAFLAGALFSFVFREKGILETKLAGIGHGFFIPVFFIYVGVSFNLGTLGEWETYPLLGQILGLCLVVKLLASMPLLAIHFRPKQIVGASLLLATPLTLLVAVASLGLELGALTELENASVILVAVLSAILFPTAFRRLRLQNEAVAAASAATPDE